MARIVGISYFCTWPHSGIAMDDLQENLVAAFGERLEWLVLGEHTHKDGEAHHHAVLRFRSSTNTSFARLDEAAGKHGNYKTTRSLIDSINYVKKDGKFSVYPPDAALPTISKVSKKRKEADQVAEDIMAGRTIREIAAEHPAYFMVNKRKVQEFHAFMHAVIPPELPWGKVSGTTLQDATLADWLNGNIKDGSKERRTHLYIVSPHHWGKSHMVNLLRKHLKVYNIAVDNGFFDLYEDDRYDLMFFDEFAGQLPINVLNMFLDPYPTTIRIKGAQGTKSDNLPAIFCSNVPPQDLYKESDQARKDAFISRFIVLEMDHPYFCIEIAGPAPEIEAPALPAPELSPPGDGAGHMDRWTPELRCEESLSASTIDD